MRGFSAVFHEILREIRNKYPHSEALINGDFLMVTMTTQYELHYISLYLKNCVHLSQKHVDLIQPISRIESILCSLRPI